MFTLIFMTCLLTGDDCFVVVAAGGYQAIEECMIANKRLSEDYNFGHRDRVVTHFMCTDDPDMIMGGKEI